MVTFAGTGRTALRAAVGALFVGHGAQKLFGWFDGPGLDAAEAEMAALGLEPARPNAVFAGASQLVAGGLLVMGLFTPAASSVIAANMITAIRTACAGKGPWGLKGGWEYQLVLTLALIAITESGPGDLSLDHALGIERRGTAWAGGALMASIVGSGAAIALGRRSGAQRVDVAQDPTGGPRNVTPQRSSSQDERA